jgi:hypothetical protein
MIRILQISQGLMGVITEICSELGSKLSETELPQAVEHICQYLQPSLNPGSDMWVTYKRRFDQDIVQFIQGIDTYEKKREVFKWLWEYNREHYSPPQPLLKCGKTHDAQEDAGRKTRCIHTTLATKRCKRRTKTPYDSCFQHRAKE